MIRILVAEDMQILRDTLVAVLNLEPDLEVVAQASMGDAVLPAALRHRPDLALVDINLPADELIGAVRRVAAGEQVIDSQLAVAALQEAENPLSPRETQILKMCAAGADPANIATELFLSYGTVRNYLTAAVTKLGARNRVDAVRIAAERGWL